MVVILPCQGRHHFHETCIKTWVKVQSTCPVCRYELKLEDF